MAQSGQPGIMKKTKNFIEPVAVKTEPGVDPKAPVEVKVEVGDVDAVTETPALPRSQEKTLLVLIEVRNKQADDFRKKLAFYKSKLEETEKDLTALQSQLSNLRSRSGKVQGKPEDAGDAAASGLGSAENEIRSSSPAKNDSSAPPKQPLSRPPLVIPSVKPRQERPGSMELNTKSTNGLESSYSLKKLNRPQLDSNKNLKRSSWDAPSSSNIDHGSSQTAKKKKAAVPRERKDLIPGIQSSSKPSLYHVQSSNLVASNHSRKLRCLAINPADDQLLITSALDGRLSLWRLQAHGSALSAVSTTNCSTVDGRWPEDVVWHPHGDKLFAAYTADGGSSQVSTINLNTSQEKRVTHFQEKPHIKGIVNVIRFMPWGEDEVPFATGGADHAVMLWQEKNAGSWKPQKVHRDIHSSGVSGVAGLQQKKSILSVGVDKRIIGFDVVASKVDFRHQVECKCIDVLPNPLDFNLFLVQTGSHGKQLRLFDIRMRQTEIHSFGWKQETSDSQSALINSAWSPDGFHISTGSADPVIHIFDIRYTGHTPSQSLSAHRKRVFKAAWHPTLSLLVSISSDLNIGLHTIE